MVITQDDFVRIIWEYKEQVSKPRPVPTNEQYEKLEKIVNEQDIEYRRQKLIRVNESKRKPTSFRR